MLRSIRFLLVTFVLALSGFLGASAASAQTALPPSLEGEQFYAIEAPQFSSGTVDVSGSCTPTAGTTSTVTYQASGLATGPYPGTFTESGTLTATVTTLASNPFVGIGSVVTWTAEFTIDSPVGDVTGTKTRSLLVPESEFFHCFGYAPPVQHFQAIDARAYLSYEATIRPADGGAFRDEGEALAEVTELECPGPLCFSEPYEFFSEYFYLSTGVLPVDTSGKATGGGQVMSGSNPLERVTFGFNVRKDENGTRLKGTCNVLDHATRTHVKCLTVTGYQQIGNTATWQGTAEVNGVREHYRITVQDNGEPNRGIDTFSIVTETYQAAGNVQHGNVQLHKQKLGL